MRHALRQAARVDENQRGAIFLNVLRDAVVDLLPHLAGGHGAEFVVGDFDRQVHRGAWPTLTMRGPGREIARHFLDGLDGGGEADALRDGLTGRAADGVEPRQGQREMRAAFVVGDRVNFVDDDGAHGAQHVAGFGGGEQDVEAIPAW